MSHEHLAEKSSLLKLTSVTLATTEQLFQYKAENFALEPFPGYTDDQWGIKAHNRPWVESVGDFKPGERAVEVGGAYSLFPKYLADKHGVESWIADDFGADEGEEMWARWGDPKLLPAKYPSVNYIFSTLGQFDKQLPDDHFDCIYSISTLEHIPLEQRLAVFQDMNRCLKPGGRQLHTIDLSTRWDRLLVSSLVDLVPFAKQISWRGQSEIRSWMKIIEKSGVEIEAKPVTPLRLFDRRILVESPDVVYRFYPPNGQPKLYAPNASLLIVIEDI